MDLEYDNKLRQIMKKYNTEVWNAECEDSPEYKDLAYGIGGYMEAISLVLA